MRQFCGLFTSVKNKMNVYVFILLTLNFMFRHFFLCPVMLMKGHSKWREPKTRINSYHIIPSRRNRGKKEGPKQIPDAIKKSTEKDCRTRKHISK